MDKKPKKGEFLEVLLRSNKTIFSTKDVTLLWGGENENAARVRLNSYVKSGKLIRVRRGLYAKDKKYSRFDLATRIYTPSYISFETVLTRAGINFQYYETIFVASYVTRDITVDGHTISFVKMKDYVLSNTTGIEHKDGYSIATKERAFLDRIYVSKDYHFDHLDSLDWDRVFQILPIYHHKNMVKKVNRYFEHYKSSSR
ncbi:MAG: type IV toxin-antitoxin system AbiEi family antitoxin domain-containing protein [Patescibacteria group bacterium]